MAFSFSTQQQPEGAEDALVFADGFADFDALANDLDAEFGERNWRIVANRDADRVIADLGEESPFAIFAISSDLPQAIDGMAMLIRIAKEAGMSILLVVGDISSRSVHRLMREGVVAPYVSPAAQDIPANWKDPAGHWTGFGARARVLILNTEVDCALGECRLRFICQRERLCQPSWPPH